jgi:hypothetical protein
MVRGREPNMKKIQCPWLLESSSRTLNQLNGTKDSHLISLLGLTGISCN